MENTYQVTGMSCGHCAAAITAEVSEIEGITAVQVSHEAGTMRVESDRAIDFAQLVAAVGEAGDYVVVEN